MPEKKKPAASAATDTPDATHAAGGAPSAPLVFTAPHGYLLVYRDGRKVAAFDGGRFATTDQDLAAYLRSVAAELGLTEDAAHD